MVNSSMNLSTFGEKLLLKGRFKHTSWYSAIWVHPFKDGMQMLEELGLSEPIATLDGEP